MTQSTAFKTEWDKLFIGGKWTEPATTDVIEVHSPATGELVGKVPLASAADVDAACAAARKAFDDGPWPHMSPQERAAVLGAAVKLMEERADELKFLLAAETGQPPTIVDMMQYGAAMSAFQYYAGAADKFTWRDLPRRRLRPDDGGAGADRCRRRGHRVERAVLPGRQQAGPRAGRRLHRRAQARRRDAAVGVRDGRDVRRGRPARGCAVHRARRTRRPDAL